MQRATLPALALSLCVLGLRTSPSRAQPLDAGAPFDAATFGIAPPPPAPSSSDGGVLGDGGVPLAAPEAAGTEAPIDVGAQAPIDVGTRTLGAGASEGVIDVTVRSRAKEGQRLQRSAEAVSVVDLQKAQQRASDLGEVLARTQGVTLRRSGGLGSSFRVFLNGLADDQIRFFLDSVPLDLAGFPQGIANTPVNLFERVEVYRAVVPLRFGVDALGGGMNLVTPQRFDTGGDVSYQVGSFHTHRLTAQARYHHEDTGFVLKASGYLDDTDNDYEVDVEVADELGQLRDAKAKRTHDRYRAWGTSLEAGVIERKWAERLLVRGYVTKYDSDLQNNLVMSVPYGEVTYGGIVGGTTLRYTQPLTDTVHLDLTGVYARRVVDFVDKAQWVYDWYGRRLRERRVPGEIGDATDQTNWQNTGYARAVLTWQPSPMHELRAASTAQFTSRTGDERLQADPTARDPLSAERKLLIAVSGVEYQLNAVRFDKGGRGGDKDFDVGLRDSTVQDGDAFSGFRLQNILFAKTYNYRVQAEDPLPGNVFRRTDSDMNGVGAGNSLRFTFTKYLYAKGSYEYAIRLPRADEVFGNNVRVDANLGLDPERSHNANLGPQLDLRRSVIGSLLVDVNWFLRDTDKQIVLLGSNADRSTYQNVYRARTLGLESKVVWVSPGRWASVDGSVTWQEQRNASSKGTFGAYKGDRIPNRPYLMGSWGSSLRFAKLLHDGDALEPFYSGRYVHRFYRGWESQGLKAYKQFVATQIIHGVGLTYLLKTDFGSVSGTLESTNLTDARVYDNFGEQKPGRAYWFKLTAQI